MPSSLLSCVRRNISGLWVLSIFEVFKLTNIGSRKYLCLVHSAVSEMLLSGIALKKGAVSLASRDPTKLLVHESRLVNASKPLNKHQEDSSRLVSSLFTTFGEREQGTVTWTKKHLKQSKVCPSKSANKVRRSRKALRPRPLASTLFSTFANKIATLVRGAVAWSRPQGGGTWRRQRLAQTETGAQRLAQTGTETGAQRLAQTETPKYQVTCYRSSHLPRAYIKLRSPRWSGVEEETKKAWLRRRQGGSKTALHCQG